MRRWTILLLGAALLAALAPGRALAQGARPLSVAAGEVIRGDLATIDRPIVIDGMVEGDVTSLSGAITVNGEVRGDVVSYAGNINLGPQAMVRGSVLSLGGGVAHKSDSKVAGQLLGEKPLVSGRIVASLVSIMPGQGSVVAADLAPPLPLLSAALTLMALLFALACAAIWPRRTRGVSLALLRAPGRALAVGLLTTALVGVLLLPIGGLLAISLVGLPLLLPLALALQLPFLFGIVCVGLALAERLRADAPDMVVAVASVALLLLPMGIIGAFAPLWSAGLFYIAASAGLGAAILSRGGAYALRAGVTPRA